MCLFDMIPNAMEANGSSHQGHLMRYFLIQPQFSPLGLWKAFSGDHLLQSFRGSGSDWEIQKRKRHRASLTLKLAQGACSQTQRTGKLPLLSDDDPSGITIIITCYLCHRLDLYFKLVGGNFRTCSTAPIAVT
jgi:hypothetical protein